MNTVTIIILLLGKLVNIYTLKKLMISNCVKILLSALISCSEQNQILTVNNTTRSEGGNEVTIPCLASHEPQATPFWKINDTIYYYSDVPWPLISSPDGTTITIPVVDLSMNGTSFQCFIPTSSGDGLISSSVGILTVTENGNISRLYPFKSLLLMYMTFLYNLYFSGQYTSSNS